MTEINNREPLVSSPISIMGNAPEVSMRSQRLDYNRGVVMVHGSHGVWRITQMSQGATLMSLAVR
jgi:hypothetical protein